MMVPMPWTSVLTRLRQAALAAALLAPSATAVSAQQPDYSVQVSDVTAKVGQRTVMLATVRFRDGYRILEHYNNRLSRFSSFDDGVAFANDMVAGAVQNGTLVFVVSVTPTKPGKHPINGVFRVGYIEDSDHMSMVSVPLIANVTGTE
jgi:hypothetical protein